MVSLEMPQQKWASCRLEWRGSWIFSSFSRSSSCVAEMKDNLRRYADNIINVFEAAEEKNPKLSVIVEELVDEL